MQLAIIGAGMAGLAAARRLRQLRPELDVVIYEKSRGPGGRVATRRREGGWVFDHGAQYFKDASAALLQLIQHELPADGLRDIGQPVWTFDGAGTITEGDPAQNRDPKWIYADGINRLGKLLAAGTELRTGAEVAYLEESAAAPKRYRIISREGQLLGEADLVLLTAPAPQSAAIIAASTIDATLRERLVAELGKASYRRCLSVTLGYDTTVVRPFYALVNTDRQHPISWLALEQLKGPERCPAGSALLVAQMAPQWSVDHWETAPDELAGKVALLVEELLVEGLGSPRWFDIQRWRYALPDGRCDIEALHSGGSGLYFAGDFTAGQGRVHLAIEQGWQVAELIAAR